MLATVNEDGGGGSSSSIDSFRWHWAAVKEVDAADMTTHTTHHTPHTYTLVR